ncbi:hypothetical protein E2C01_049593 [Portunus trituberculatus]|uniref:Uncharacterized protein n=1 Tax=Portunus trituberculatus TaxID=210409 RepID=A0A5B7G604_PORTR|nr:hypothetical protein [Portunus trituberculatus]
MKAAVHTSTTQQPAPHMVGNRLPTVDGEESDLDIARRVIRETHEKITQKYWSVANRKHKEQRLDVGKLVWVKRETTDSGVCKKLGVKWNELYKVIEVLRNRGGYVVTDPFTEQLLQRAAEKLKPFYGEEQYLLEPLFHADVETEVLPSRLRRPLRQYIEKC